MLAMQRRGDSFHRLFDSVGLPLLSQHHSTARPSPKRYDKRYEETFQENICLHHQPRGHGGTGDVEVGDTSLLTSFSMSGEYTSNTLSERREWLVRASATASNVRVLQNPHKGFSRLVFDLLPNPSIDHLVAVILKYAR